jgi:hypothetical protein
MTPVKPRSFKGGWRPGQQASTCWPDSLRCRGERVRARVQVHRERRPEAAAPSNYLLMANRVGGLEAVCRLRAFDLARFCPALLVRSG